jgi:hypothetical protein
MTAIRHNIELYRGGTFTLLVACVVQTAEGGPVEVRDLTGWTGAMQVRSTVDGDIVLAEADVEVDVATGVVTAIIEAADTEAMTWRSGVYDLVITDGIDIEPLAEGDARLRRLVTRT